MKVGDLVRYRHTPFFIGVLTLVAPGGTHPWAEVMWSFARGIKRDEVLLADVEVINEKRLNTVEAPASKRCGGKEMKAKVGDLVR